MPYKNRQQRLAAQKKHYETNKGRYMSNQYRRRVERAEWFFEYKKTLACACGENHPACIQFHHRNPLEKEADVAFLVAAGYSKEVILAEIAKCEVICSNCHLKKHWLERVEAGRSRLTESVVPGSTVGLQNPCL